MGNQSSDIIESISGVYKVKLSFNKLNGITAQVLLLPLYPKVDIYSVSKKQDIKERLANVRLADVEP